MSEPLKVGQFINIYGSATDFFNWANFTLFYTNGKRNWPANLKGCVK